MEKELNIAAILKEKPEGTKLWSPIFGDCILNRLTDNGIRVFPVYKGYTSKEEKSFFNNGKYTLAGEICLFLSKQMQDWSKLAWKKGDVLSCGVDSLCIFNKWENDEYTEFDAEYVTPNYSGAVLKTKDWAKVTNEDTIKQHISKVEKINGGKLNLETLEIEQPKPEFKDGDIVFVACEKGLAENTFIYKMDDVIDIHDEAQYYAAVFNKKNKLATCGSVLTYGRTLRLATDSEKQQLFSALAKEGKRWNQDTKQIEDLPKKCEFKAFDKVLVRDVNSQCWIPSFFAQLNPNAIRSIYKYGIAFDNGFKYFAQCIPYNEETKHLLGTTDDWEGQNNG